MTSTWVIDAVKLGEARGLPAADFYLQDRTQRSLSIPMTMFVLRAGGRTVVVDTGGPSDEQVIRRHHSFEYRVAPEEYPEAALSRIGVRPADVDLVVNTHLHWDHCSNNHLFPNAEIVVQRAELGYAVAPCPAHLAAYGIHPGDVPPFAQWLERVRALDGAARLAPGLEIVPLPGHSPGSQGVRVDAGDGTYVITGDCVDTLENWDHAGTGEPLPSGRFTDLPAFYSSLTMLKGTGWIPLPGHDHSIVDKGRFGTGSRLRSDMAPATAAGPSAPRTSDDRV
ncbi:N-acyl homoserine lactonase family protein [Streptomyces sp. NPDC094034]|uniref:N-acyl homoserine lactonase family protein n=1 Tax=Streptomyces sp. NPDC094034 TaxID=3155309 RepID=UPI003331EF76